LNAIVHPGISGYGKVVHLFSCAVKKVSSKLIYCWSQRPINHRRPKTMGRRENYFSESRAEKSLPHGCYSRMLWGKYRKNPADDLTI